MLQQRLESGTFLPFNDQAPLYNTITWEVFGPNFEGSPQNPSIWNDDATLENGLETTIPVFACPSPGHPTNVNRESIDKRVPSNYGGVQSGAFGNPIVTTPNKRSIGHKSHMDDSLGINDFSGDGGGHDRIYGIRLPLQVVRMGGLIDGTLSLLIG